jgi:hypothetical protein
MLAFMQRDVMSMAKPWKKVENRAFAGCVYTFALMGDNEK